MVALGALGDWRWDPRTVVLFDTAPQSIVLAVHNMLDGREGILKAVCYPQGI